MVNKYIHFLLLLLFLWNSAIAAQKQQGLFYGKVSYIAIIDTAGSSKTLQKAKEKHPDSYPLLLQTVSRSQELIQHMKVELHFNQSEAISFAREDALFMNDDPIVHLMATQIIGVGPGRHYLNQTERKRIEEASFNEGISYVHVQKDWMVDNWVLSDETKQIGNYLCRKAITSRNSETECCGTYISHITAWYAPELPYPFGPADYDNLPGLVLEVEIDHPKRFKILRAEEIQIHSNSRKKIPQLHDPFLITTEEELNESSEKMLEIIKGGN